MFVNTTHERGPELARSDRHARRQEDTVAAWFAQHAGEWTPEEVHRACIGAGVPLTSTRRAMTMLADAGVLEKTETRRRGSFGKLAHCWRYRRQGELFGDSR